MWASCRARPLPPNSVAASSLQSPPHPLIPSQNLRQMHRLHTRLLSMQSPLNMHQAGVVTSRTSLSLRIQNRRYFIPQHRARNIGILHREGSTKSATLLQPFQLDQINPSHSFQKPHRTIPEQKIPQPMTTSVISHPMRIISPNILQPQPLRQKLRKLKHLRQQHINLSNQPLILQRQSHLRIMIPHHRHTRRRRHHNCLGPAKLFNKSRKQRHRLSLIARVVMHLTATRLPRRKLHRMSQALQHPHHGLTRLRKKCVVIAGNEK